MREKKLQKINKHEKYEKYIYKIDKNVKECIKMEKTDIQKQKYTNIYKNIQQHIKIYNSIQKYKQYI